MKVTSKRDILREIIKITDEDHRVMVNDALHVTVDGLLRGIGDKLVAEIDNDWPGRDEISTIADVEHNRIQALITLYYLAD